MPIRQNNPFILFTLPLVLIAFLISGCGTTLLKSVNMSQELASLKDRSIKKHSQDHLPIELNAHTFRFMRIYLTSNKNYLKTVVERSYYFVPMMQRVFKEEGLPEELIYLPVIESGFVLSAISPKKATGPWQFMSYTGKIFGLQNDWWHDERMDPEKSTRAAARFLKDLYRSYGDWYLALAAYNCGPGRVSRAIRKTGTRDFWKLCDPQGKILPKETQNYVPKYLASIAVIMNMDSFGFGAVNKCDPLLYDTITVPDSTDLQIIAKCSGTNMESIRFLNPELKQWATPPERTNFQVKIPANRKTRFMTNFANIPPGERVTYRRYQIQPNDTISGIAAKYKVPQEVIMSFNKISNPGLIRVNDHVIIPIRGTPGTNSQVGQATNLPLKKGS